MYRFSLSENAFLSYLNDRTMPGCRFIYITKAVEGEFKPEMDIINLEKFTEYIVHIQAYNDKGRGPLSEDYKVFTLEDGNLMLFT